MSRSVRSAKLGPMSESQSGKTPPGAGWYDDGSGNKRWWDGQSWGPYEPSAKSTETHEHPQANGAAIAGLVLGIIALLLSWVPGVGVFVAVFGILFSGVGLWLVKQRQSGRGIASAGMVLSVVSAVIFLLLLLLTVTRNGTG